MNSCLPTLSEEGFVTNKNVLIGKLFKYFLASNYSQSNTFYGDISSLNWIIANNIPDEKLKADLETALVKLYGRYFDKVNFTISIDTDETDVAQVCIEGVIQDEDNTYTLSKVVAVQGTTIVNFENLLDEYYSEVGY